MRWCLVLGTVGCGGSGALNQVWTPGSSCFVIDVSTAVGGGYYGPVCPDYFEPMLQCANVNGDAWLTSDGV
jgi:hypothetical protein